MDFHNIALEELDQSDLDALEFGVIRMNSLGVVEHYNTAEAKISGLTKERVEGRNFFEEVGICMNNYMVALRFEESGRLDDMLDYVFTARMDPTPVSLRLLKSDDSEFRYLLVRPK
ncbi:MAG: hypothetical protein AAF756_09390 [Pseudomonadota bacterium]